MRCWAAGESAGSHAVGTWTAGDHSADGREGAEYLAGGFGAERGDDRIQSVPDYGAAAFAKDSFKLSGGATKLKAGNLEITGGPHFSVDAAGQEKDRVYKVPLAQVFADSYPLEPELRVDDPDRHGNSVYHDGKPKDIIPPYSPDASANVEPDVQHEVRYATHASQAAKELKTLRDRMNSLVAFAAIDSDSAKTQAENYWKEANEALYDRIFKDTVVTVDVALTAEAEGETPNGRGAAGGREGLCLSPCQPDPARVRPRRQQVCR